MNFRPSIVALMLILVLFTVGSAKLEDVQDGPFSVVFNISSQGLLPITNYNVTVVPPQALEGFDGTKYIDYNVLIDTPVIKVARAS